MTITPDLNNDGRVDGADLSILFANFGKTVEPVPAPIAPHWTVQAAPEFHHYVTVSSVGDVTPDNPRGWHPQYRAAFKTAGCFALMDQAVQAVRDGKTGFWLWEPTGQQVGLADGKMAFASQAAFEDGCEPAMRETFEDFCKTLAYMGLAVGVYCGAAPRPNFGSTLRPDNRVLTPTGIDWYVRQLAFWSRMGVTMWAGDEMSWGLANDPALWERLILQVREDVDAQDMLLVSELWLPGREDAGASSKLTMARRQFFLSQLYPMLLCRTGGKTEPDAANKDEYWKLVRHAEERTLVPDMRGCVMLHGSKWTQDQRINARLQAAKLGLDVVTHYSREEVYA